MLFGQRLKDLRKQKGLTQQQLGELIDVTKASICYYEKSLRTPTLDTLMDLSKVLDVSISYLLGQEVNTYISEAEEEYGKTYLSRNDVNFINEIKADKRLYNNVMKDTKRAVEVLRRTIG